MKRLSTSVPQKHLRTLTPKHSGQGSGSTLEKVESPLMKVDSNGNISCVICRAPLKSANIWKVHVNSKAHKSNVQAAKELKIKLLYTNTTLALNKNVPMGDSKVHGHIATSNVKKPSNLIECKPKVQTQIIQEKSFRQSETIAPTLHDPLPEEFFDKPATATTKSNSADDKDKEWELFQKEIKEVTEAANEIFAADQKELAVEKEIIEIDEQIQHWSKVLDLEEKRKKLSNKGIGKNKIKQIMNETEEASSEGEDFEEYTDWRSKEFK
ncbi:zinc finger protein 830 [Stomoxys calcitrans]|uniref:Zinc finger protein 830 n=1 Tax=Stomoxys calcitrans TaxID=35570 RepID=A0A1I8PCG1_STOCA|nr:zinc finger protein 830 [Stomoxys calcitrans]